MKHQLDLLGNAVDSLNEGLHRFAAAREGDVRSYKFAVLHVSHFLELLFKHAVALQHPLLVYERPASKNVKKERTIGLWDAVNILNNAGVNLDKSLIKDLEWLKALRNDIEHYAFEMNVKEVRAAIGRIIRASEEFASATKLDPLSDSLDHECHVVFDELLDEYEEKRANARADAREAVEEGGGEVVECSWCGESDVAVQAHDKVHCFSCDHDEPRYECSICYQMYRDHEMSVWNNDDPDHVAYICEYCHDSLFDKD
jgi:regulator of protease activity HflC (stomatin/prohibitin superfamily)